jgi:predicted transcriptional regulator
MNVNANATVPPDADPVAQPLLSYIERKREAEPRYGKQTLAEEAGVSRNAIYRVLAGDDAVSTDLFEKLEATTGISAVELFAAWKATRDRRGATAD